MKKLRTSRLTNAIDHIIWRSIHGGFNSGHKPVKVASKPRMLAPRTVSTSEGLTGSKKRGYKEIIAEIQAAMRMINEGIEPIPPRLADMPQIPIEYLAPEKSLEFTSYLKTVK